MSKITQPTEEWAEEVRILRMKVARQQRALNAVALLAEQRRKYDRDECCIRMGDVVNLALYNRRGPGTGMICTGKFVPKCPDCEKIKRCCAFHSTSVEGW
ncbi:hypothetical protein KAU11_11120 [Candidatus Babeliales bacterium]|nr:hypothetical protein [Candidatus Babeliales bacterium]